MAARPEQLLRYLRRLASGSPSAPDSDATLLERFARDRDEAAFAALVARYGRMIRSVCRRVLRDPGEAEDAAQATWLVLARKASALRRPQALAAWLHGTARLLGQQVAVLDTGTGKQRYKLEAGGTGIHTAFSADGKLIVTGAEDGVLHLAEASTGRERLRRRQSGPVTAVALSADSRLIAAAVGREGSTVRLWEVATGQEVLQLAGRGAEVTCLVFAPDGKTVATGCYDSTALIWSLAPGGRSPGRVVTELSAKGIERLWADLADGDGPRAYAAVWGLASAPGQAIPFLRQQLKPAAEIDRNRLRRLLGDLDEERFAVREAALQELERLGEDAAPALRQALAGKPSLEVRRRLEELLSRAKVLRPGERLRGVRAVEVLERIGTLEAKHLLKKLAEGAPEARLTREAKASLQRLAKRAAANR